MNEAVAKVYDELVGDEEATNRWLSFTQKYVKQEHSILELASGSGNLAIVLKELGYQVVASDISNQMLDSLKEKSRDIEAHCINMCDFQLYRKFDAILCYCDSVNYLKSFDELKQMMLCAKEHLNDDGVILFDMHAKERLDEFSEMYIEEGELSQCQYQWTIASQEKNIHHHFSFWFKDGVFLQESHQQIVYDPQIVETMMKELGFEVSFWTDFDIKGVQPGEKIFVVGRKIK